MITALEVLDDIFQHRYTWLTALIETKKHAEIIPPDIDDKSFWDHEIKAFSSTINDIQQILNAPKTDASTLADICDALDAPGLSGTAVSRIKFLLEQQEELLDLKANLVGLLSKFR